LVRISCSAYDTYSNGQHLGAEKNGRKESITKTEVSNTKD
jgi:hypothetical protein